MLTYITVPSYVIRTIKYTLIFYALVKRYQEMQRQQSLVAMIAQCGIVDELEYNVDESKYLTEVVD